MSALPWNKRPSPMWTLLVMVMLAMTLTVILGMDGGHQRATAEASISAGYPD